uniref:Uncharacterized protein AlNc14C1G61 n=1 Tax=Albugo laibachii Nc14 TaxID=890382 RepID=F0VYQ9_9STRA|nr:conserved hypothetical protein [Albugo laibachii Nc14]|eukprot:CCA13923.1 conserved hypothetical protein [Albugo laibachii Nc14]
MTKMMSEAPPPPSIQATFYLGRRHETLLPDAVSLDIMSDKGHVATEESVASVSIATEKDALVEPQLSPASHPVEKPEETNTNGTNQPIEKESESAKNLAELIGVADVTSIPSQQKAENEDTESDPEPQKKKIKIAKAGSTPKKKAPNSSRKRKATSSEVESAVDFDIISRVAALPQEVKDLFGQLVWAKMQGYPYWPALVVDPRYLPASQQKQAIRSFETSKYWVFFYRARNFGPVPCKSVEKWLDASQKYREGFPAAAAKPSKRRKELMGAIEDADVDYKLSVTERAAEFLEYTDGTPKRASKAQAVSSQQASQDQVAANKESGSTPTINKQKVARPKDKIIDKVAPGSSVGIEKNTLQHIDKEKKSQAEEQPTPAIAKDECGAESIQQPLSKTTIDKIPSGNVVESKIGDASIHQPLSKTTIDKIPSDSPGNVAEGKDEKESIKQPLSKTTIDKIPFWNVVESKSGNDSIQQPLTTTIDKEPSNSSVQSVEDILCQSQPATHTLETKSDPETQRTQVIDESTKGFTEMQLIKIDIDAQTSEVAVVREVESGRIDWLVFGKRLTSLSEDESANRDELLQMLTKVFEAKKIWKVDIEKSGVGPVISKLRKSTNPSLAQTAKSLRKYLIATLNKDLKAQDNKSRKKQNTTKSQDSTLNDKSNVKEISTGKIVESQTEHGERKKDEEKTASHGPTEAESIGDQTANLSSKPEQLADTKSIQSEKVPLESFKVDKPASTESKLEPATCTSENVDASCHVEGLVPKEAAQEVVTSNGQVQKQTPEESSESTSVATAAKIESTTPALDSEASTNDLKSTDSAAKEPVPLIQEPKKDEYRLRVIEMLTISLGSQYGNLAEAIEQCIYDRFTESNDLYRAHARLVTFTLKDDEKLKSRVLSGSIHGFELAYATNDFLRQTRKVA